MTMRPRVWNDPEAGWWHYEVQGHGLRIAGARRSRQDAADEAVERGWKFCASVRDLAEAGMLPLSVRRGSVTVESE